MKTSNFSVNDSQKAANFALPYGEEKEQVKLIPFRNIDQIGPAGSINSSVREMANWVIAQINSGKFKDREVIPERVLRETHTPQIVSGTTLRYDELFYSMYAMGWGVNSYRGHLLLTHGGGIDGFTAQVSLMPKDKLGIVILTNKGGSRLPGILAFNVYDRLLGLEAVPWNDRNKEEVAKAREAQEKAAQEGDKNRKTGTQPSHALAEFAGEYEHPGYGMLRIEHGSDLRFFYNGLSSPLRHYHYDVFEAAGEEFDKMKFNFLLNSKGEVDRVSVPLQSGVGEIVFTRKLAVEPLARDILEKLVGQYEISTRVITISIRDDGRLMASIPGQPDYELVRVKGLEFNLKGLKGFSMEFHRTGDAPASELVITQPNGAFTAKRK